MKMCISRPEAMPIWIKKKRSKSYVHWVYSVHCIVYEKHRLDMTWQTKTQHFNALHIAHKINMTGYRLVCSPHTLCTRSKMIKIASFQNMKQYRWKGNMIFHLFVCLLLDLLLYTFFINKNNNKWNDFELHFYLSLLNGVWCCLLSLAYVSSWMWLRVLRRLVCSCGSYLIWCIRLAVNRNNSLFSILS